MTNQQKQKQKQNQNKNKIKSNPIFQINSLVQVKSDALFSEKSDKNKLVYQTYKGKKGSVVSILHNNGKDITYLIQMTSNKGTTFNFDILEKYLEEFVQIDLQNSFQINDKVFVKQDADFYEKSEDNKKSYETFKNREGTVVEIKHKTKDSDSSTFIVEMYSTVNTDKKFTFDILGKYLTKNI